MDDLISRQAAIDALYDWSNHTITDAEAWHLRQVIGYIKSMPSAQPERMTNRQWIDFLSVQFDISRTSAKEMLHGMMQWKKEDNFKKLSNGGQDETD